VHVSGQTEISDFHNIVFRHKDISGSQVSVDALGGELQTHNEHSTLHLHTNICMLRHKCRLTAFNQPFTQNVSQTPDKYGPSLGYGLVMVFSGIMWSKGHGWAKPWL